MKKTFLFLICCVWGWSAYATENRDHILKTTDQTCAMHYLTDKNTTGWSLKESSVQCDEGWLSGYQTITVLDAFRRPIEQMYGYFRQGYWTGNKAIAFPITEVSASDKNTLTFQVDLGKNPQFDMPFYAQLRSERMVDGTYGALHGCTPVRLLSVTDQKHVFEDETVQQDLLNVAIHKAQDVCPDAELIYFFAADMTQPTDENVFFFADLDLAHKQIRVRRLPSYQRKAVSAQTTTSLPVRPEPVGVPVMRVTPIRPTVSSASKISDLPQSVYNRKEDKLSPDMEREVPEEISEVPVTPPTVMSSVFPVPESISATLSIPSTVVEQQVISPVATVATIPPLTPVVYDAVPHLLTASRLLQKPVDGLAAVHVSRVDLSGQAWIDAPVPMKANGQLVPIGWSVVTGRFMALAPDSHVKGAIAPRGSIQILSAQPCPDTGCFVKREGN